MKTTSSEDGQSMGRTYSALVVDISSFDGNSMNNLLSYCGLIDAKIRASDKDLPVLFTVFPHIVSALEYFPPLNTFPTFMYCDFWPYELWPLDFQVQKRIVSAETI
jgi:hypothetical protein